MWALPANCPVRALGLDFPGPVGLAAGFDRDGRHLRDVLGWGFGFVELGTVTPQPLSDHNPGVAVLAANLVRSGVLDRGIGARPVIGVSLGMQPGSPPELARLDYVRGMQALWSSADYLVLNFTSSITQGLHEDHRQHILFALLADVRSEQRRLAAGTGRHVPLLVKWPVRPVADDAVVIAQRIRSLGYDGMVAGFDLETSDVPAWEAWVPRACRAVAQAMAPQMTLVAVGGIDCAQRARALRQADAGLLQLYRGFVAQGPSLVQAVARAWIGRDLTATGA